MTAAEARTEAEDRVGQWLNGGQCSKTIHIESTRLDQLVMLRALRVMLPHDSTNVRDLDWAIQKELRKVSKA